MVDDAAEFTVSLNDKISAGAKSASSSLDGLDKKLKSTSKSTDEAGSAADAATGGMAALAGAIIATEAAAAGLVLAMAKMSIKASETQESARALAEAQYGSADAAKAVVDAQYRVSAASSLSQDKVFGLATELEDAGVSANAFEQTLRALADTAAVAGEKAVKPLEKVIKTIEQTGKFQLKETALKGSGIKMAEIVSQLAEDTGTSVDKVKAAMKAGSVAAEDGLKAIDEVAEKHFHEQARKKMSAFGALVDKASENLTNLFKDVNVKPFTNALKQVLSILDPATASGKALKSALTGAMNSFFKAAANTLPYIEAFFLGIGIAGLDIYIALKPSIKAIEKALGFDGKTTSNGLKTAATAGKALVAVLFGIGVVAAALVAITALPFVVMGTAIYLGIKAVKALKAPFIAAGHSIKNGLSAGVDYVESLPGKFADAGNAMIEGLVNAIKAGADAVVGAVKGVMEGAIKAGKAVIGMKSPAKKFGEMGDASVTGYVQAVDKGQGKAQASIKSLLTIPARAVANDNARAFGRAATPAASSSGGGSVTVQSGAVVIQIYAQPGQSAQDIGEEVDRRILTTLRRIRTGTGG